MLIKIPRRRITPSISILEAVKLFFTNKTKNGEEIEKFEKTLGKYLGCKYVMATYSGKQALYLILKSLDLEKGSEILLPSYTAQSVPATIVHAGFKPVFVDVEIETFNINPKLIENKINEKTKAIIATHVHGLPCNMESLSKLCKKYELVLIEDCAHALGAEYKGKKVGNFGHASFFSFGVGKHLSTIGGGAIATNDQKIIKKARSIMKDFEFPKNSELFFKLVETFFLNLITHPLIFTFTIYPFLCILDENVITRMFEKRIPLDRLPKEYKKKFSNLQAFLGLKQFESFEVKLSKRIKNALILKSKLQNSKDVKIQEYPNFIKHSYLDFAVLVKKRKEIIRKLLKKDVDVQKTWLDNCSALTDFESNSITPISDKLSKGVIYLPLDPSFNEELMFKISEILKSVLSD